MTSFARKRPDGSPEDLAGTVTLTIAGEDVRFDISALPGLDPATLATNDVAEIVEPGAEPTDVRVLGTALTYIGDIPIRVWTVAPFTQPEAAAIVWERVKALREAKANSSAATPFGHRADSDSESRLRISGAVQLADKAVAAREPFAINWTMADNVLVPLDAAGMSALGIAVGQHYAACYTRAQELRTEIATSADPFTIDIDAGWPA